MAANESIEHRFNCGSLVEEEGIVCPCGVSNEDEIVVDMTEAVDAAARAFAESAGVNWEGLHPSNQFSVKEDILCALQAGFPFIYKQVIPAVTEKIRKEMT